MKRAAALALGLLLAEGVASACGNAMYLATDRARRMIADAEEALENNQPQKALSLLPSGRYRLRGAAPHEIEASWDGPSRAASNKGPSIDDSPTLQTYFQHHPENDRPEMKSICKPRSAI